MIDAPAHPATRYRSALLEELRTQYEAACTSPQHEGDACEDFASIDARLRKSFRWLERAVTYLNTLKPPIDHRFDLGYGFAFDSPRFAHGSVAQHERRIRGFPVIDEMSVYYDIAAAKPLTIDVPAGWVAFAQRTLDAFDLQYTSHEVEDAGNHAGKRVFRVLPVIPARISFAVDHRTGAVTVTLVNVDRLDRISLAFESTAIGEPMLDDLVRLVLGRDSRFLRRAPLAGMRRPPNHDGMPTLR